MGWITPQELNMRGGMETYEGIHSLTLDGDHRPVLRVGRRSSYTTDENLNLYLRNDGSKFIDDTFFYSKGETYVLSGNLEEYKLQMRKSIDNDFKVILNVEHPEYISTGYGASQCIPQASGDVIFWERNTESCLRALYSVEKNTVSPLFPIDENDAFFLRFIDEYGYHYFYNEVLDINGNYVAPLQWAVPEGDSKWTQGGKIQGGNSNNFFYSFVETEGNEYKDAADSWEYETGIKIYSIFRCKEYWEVIYEGVAPLNQVITTRRGPVLSIAPPLKNYTSTQLEEQIYNNTTMDEEGRIYYMELDADELRVMRVTVDLDVKFIKWARDGITEAQVSTPPDEIVWYLEQATPEELRLFRNAFFALKNYQFKSDDLTDYFSRYSWYKPNHSVKADAALLSDNQRRLLDLIRQYEEK